jgi:hypothetical protein
MQAKKTKDLDGAIIEFATNQKNIFINTGGIINFLKQRKDTVYRYDPDDKSLVSNPLPPIVQSVKNRLTSLVPLDDGLGTMRTQDEKEKKSNDQLAEKEAWDCVFNVENKSYRKAYKQLITEILDGESQEVKEAIAEKFKIEYIKPNLNASLDPSQQKASQEEVKELLHGEKITLQDLLQESPCKDSMNTILGSQVPGEGAAKIVAGIIGKRKEQEQGREQGQEQINSNQTDSNKKRVEKQERKNEEKQVSKTI